MTVSDGTRKYIRLADAMRQELAISGARLGILRIRHDLVGDEHHDNLYESMGRISDLVTELIESSDDLYNEEWEDK